MFNRIVGSLAIAGLMLAWMPPAARANEKGQAVQRAYIVVLQDSVSDAAGVAAEMSAGHGAAVTQTYSHVFNGYAAVMPESEAAELASDPRVLYVAEDRPVALDAQVIPTGVDRIEAQQTGTHTNTGAGVHVAVIDTGIDLDHRDLRANIAGGRNCSDGKSYADGHGHGTHVAGTIAAVDNKRGVVGVAPEANLWAVRVLNATGSGTISTVICGIDFVTSKAPANGGPITVANMSLGGFGVDDGNCGNTNGDPLHQAICRSVAAGVTYVVAAGNSTTDAANFVPAAYDEVITVSAFTDSDGQPGSLGAPPECRPAEADDHFASFSNYGADVDLAAPGVCILSAWLDGDYRTISGTSMAAPHVAAVAALYIATHPGATPAEVRDALIAAAQPGGLPGDPDGIGEGIVDASDF